MRTTIKILLLLAAIALCAFGIRHYIRTITQPPSHISFCNQFVQSIEGDIATLKSTTTKQNQREATFSSLSHKIPYLHSEGLIDDNEAANLSVKFYTEYASLFINDCDEMFGKQTWPQDRLAFAKSRADQLLKAEQEPGVPAISGKSAQGQDLKGILETLALYDEAQAMSGNYTPGTPLSVISARLDRAEFIRNKHPLSNCTDVAQHLSSLQRSISLSHYEYLERATENLSKRLLFAKYWSQSDRDKFIADCEKTLNDIKEYQNAGSIYGTALYDTSSLERKAENAKSKAYVGGTPSWHLEI